MKTEQIQLVLEISKCGSISKAAQQLYMAQPNASTSLCSLEQELGYKILDRSHNGVKFTPKGEEFLQFARSIQRSMENIYSLRDKPQKIRLSVAAYAYPFAENAFVRFCRKYTCSAKSLSCALKRIGTVREGIDLLTSGLADISIIVCRREIYGLLEGECRQNGLCSLLLGHTFLYITMSRNHPMAHRDLTDLMDYAGYPCLSNAGLSKNYGTPEIESLLESVKMHIVIDPTDARLSLLKTSEGFSISTPYEKQVLDRYGLISKKIPNAERCLLILMREEDRPREELQDYTKMVKKELSTWFSGI